MEERARFNREHVQIYAVIETVLFVIAMRLNCDFQYFCRLAVMGYINAQRFAKKAYRQQLPIH